MLNLCLGMQDSAVASTQTDRQTVSLAPIFGGSTIDLSDILNVIRGKRLVEDLRDDEEFTFVSQLLELRVKCAI